MDPYPDFFIKAAELRGVYDSTEEDAAALAALLTARGARRVLDIPCGFGRIAGPLHARGFDVVGVDASAAQLAEAEARNPGPTYRLGDMKAPPDGPFDAVLNIYTSFGYMPTPAEDAACLAAWHAVLRPGGILVLETLDTVRVAAIDETERHLQRPDGVFVRETGPLTEHIYTDPDTNIMSITYAMDGQEFTSRTRLYHRDDLRRLLQEAGFARVEVYAGFDLSPVEADSHTLFLAVKGEEAGHGAA
jgi:SAM-dependent methyltransferase